MYGRPREADLSAIKGQRLIQICFGQNETQLRFDDGAALTAEVDIAVSDRGASDRASPRERLLSLLGHCVVAARFPTDDKLIIQFDNDVIVSVLDENESYESFQIKVGDIDYVV